MLRVPEIPLIADGGLKPDDFHGKAVVFEIRRDALDCVFVYALGRASLLLE